MKRTLAGVAISIFLGFGIVLVLRGEEESRLLLPGLPGEIDALRVANDSMDARFTLEGGEWRLSGPPDDRADSLVIATLLDLLRRSEVLRVVDERPESSAPFGLDPPRARVEVAGRVVEIGGRSTSGAGVYARVIPGERVLLAGDAIAPFVDLAPRRVRDRRLLRFPYRDVTTVIVTGGGATITLRREGRRSWRALEAGLRAAPMAAYGVLRALTDSKIHSFRDGVPFDPGPEPVRYTVGWPGGEAFFDIGAPIPETSLFEARASDREGSFAVPRYVADSLAAHVAAPLDSALFASDPTKAARVRLDRGEGSFAVERREGGWWIVMEETFPADAARARAFLRNVGALRARRFLPRGEAPPASVGRWVVDVDGESAVIDARGDSLVAWRAGESGALVLTGAAQPVLRTTAGDLLVTGP